MHSQRPQFEKSHRHGWQNDVIRTRNSGFVMIYFPRHFAVGIVLLVLLYAVGLLLWVYFQGGVDRAIHLTG
jgi:hypothetical protein